MADTLSVSQQSETKPRRPRSKSGASRPGSGGRSSRRPVSSVGDAAPQIRMEKTEDEEVPESKKRFQDIEERRLREWENYQRSHRSTIEEMNPTVFLDVMVGDVPCERVVIELFEDIVPHTTQNFRALCTGTAMYDETTGIKLDYTDSTVHRLQPGVAVHMGMLGAHSISSTGTPLRDENFKKRHTERGLLSMVSHGPNTVGSTFCITLDAAPVLDYTQVVFGKVVDGFASLEKIEKVETNRIGVPKAPVVISFCGALTGDKPTGTHVSLEEWRPATATPSEQNTPRDVSEDVVAAPPTAAVPAASNEQAAEHVAAPSGEEPSVEAATSSTAAPSNEESVEDAPAAVVNEKEENNEPTAADPNDNENLDAATTPKPVNE